MRAVSLAQFQRWWPGPLLDSSLSHSVPLALSSSAHPANRSSEYFFLAVSGQDRNYKNFCHIVLKFLRSSEAQSLLEENSFPGNSWEKPPGQTSCLSVVVNRVIWEGRWFEWAQMVHFKPQPATTLEPFYFAVISFHVTEMFERDLGRQHVLKDDNCKWQWIASAIITCHVELNVTGKAAAEQHADVSWQVVGG